MKISHPKVQRIVKQSERRIKKLTGNDSVTLLVIKPPTAKVTFEDIERVVCEVRGVKRSDVRMKCRKRHLVIVRQLICYFAKSCCGLSLVSIGELLGGRDHTTVIHSITAIRSLIETCDDLVYDDVQEISRQLNQISKIA